MKSWFSKLNKWVKRVIWLFLLVAIGFVVKYLFFPAKEENTNVTAIVTKMDLEDTVLATGVTNAYKQVNVGAQVSGQIESLNVEIGQNVKKGDVLALIDAQTQRNNLQSAEAELVSNEAALVSHEATLQKAKLEFDRQAMMIKSGATSKAEYDSAKASLALAKANIATAKANIKRSKLAIETAKVSLGYTKVLAPMDGVVVSVAVEEGQTVNANQTTPTILVLAQLDKMTIKAEISEGDVFRLKEGMEVDFTILGDSTHHYKTKLRSVDPAPTALVDNSNIDVNTLTDAIYYYGMMDVDNNDRRLKIGMTTQMTIFVNKVNNVLAIPSAALGAKNKKGEYEVRILDKDNKIDQRWVRIGVNNNINAEVISGLKENEQVIVSQGTSTISDTTQARAQARMSRMGAH